MTPLEEALARALNQAHSALTEVQPQIRGALCVQSVQQAIERIDRVVAEYSRICRICGGFAGLLDVCGSCEAEAYLNREEP